MPQICFAIVEWAGWSDANINHFKFGSRAIEKQILKHVDVKNNNRRQTAGTSFDTSFN